MEHRDGINLFIIKMTGTVLTALTICGYLDAVSNWDWLLNIHIIIFSIVLLLINLMGYSVYLIKMKRDSTSDATLLNHLYTGMAIMNQVNSILMFSMTLGDVLDLTDSTIYVSIEFVFKFLIFLQIGNLVTVTAATLFKHLSPTEYLRVSQNMLIIQTIMASKICIAVGSFLLAVWKCDSDLTCVGLCGRIMWLPFGVICFIVLFKIADDNYKIIKKMKLRLRKMLRTNNSLVHLNPTLNQVRNFLSLSPLDFLFLYLYSICDFKYAQVVEDQSVLICMSGVIISVVAGVVITILRTFFGLEASRHMLYMVPPGLVPIYWIHKSEKLQEVMWICLRRRRSRIIIA